MSETGGRTNVVTTSGFLTTPNWGVVFDATQNFTLNSTTIYPVGTGTVTIALLDAAGTELAVTSAIAVSGTGQASPNVIPLGFAVSTGTNYKLVLKAYTGITNLLRESSGNTFPYPSPSGAISVTAGWTGSGTSTSYYWFYSLQIGIGCASARTEVVATVTDPPAITPSANPTSVCAGALSTLDVTSGNPNYVYTWTPGNLVGATQSVYPETTTNYMVEASDGTCTTTGSVLVTVLTTPSPITITPAAPVIAPGAIQELTATGGSVTDVLIFSEDFNNLTNSWTTINNSTGGVDPLLVAWTLRPDGYTYSTFGTWHSNDNSQFYLSNSDAGGSGTPSLVTATILQSPAFSTVGFTAATLRFYHHLNWLSNSSKVDYSIDGTNWINLQTYVADVGSVGAFVQEIITLPAGALNQPSVYIRFKYDGGWDYFWGIDNVSVSGTTQSSMVWSPITSLFTDALASNAYAGENLATVWAQPAATITYTATATASGTGCTRTKDVTVTVGLPMSLDAVVTNAACPTSYDGAIDLTVTNGVAPFTYLWSNAETTQDLTGLAPGTYTVTVTDDNMASATGSWVVGQDDPICDNISVSGTIATEECFDAYLTISVSGLTIEAPNGDVDFLAGQNIVFSPPVVVQSGAHMLAKITTQFCNVAKSPVASATGTDEPEVSLNHAFFTLYPNPTTGNFTLVQKGDKAYGTVKVEIFSMNGSRVMTGQMIGEKKTEFVTSALPTGIYFVKIVADDYVETIKLIKTR
jgi:hypothetical protein